MNRIQLKKKLKKLEEDVCRYRDINNIIELNKGLSITAYRLGFAIAGLCWKYVDTLKKDKSKRAELEKKYLTLKQFVDLFGEYAYVKITDETYQDFKQYDFKPETNKDPVFLECAEKICAAYDRELADDIKKYFAEKEMNQINAQTKKVEDKRKVLDSINQL